MIMMSLWLIFKNLKNGSEERTVQVGQSGMATGSHLHFELTIYGEFVDLMKYID
ncbi:MAG: hypothetical protein RRZ73_04600 [Oscillospiraceae bacterium]